MIADWIKFPSRYVRTRLYCTTYLLVPIINTYSLKQAQNIQTEIYLHKYLSLLYRYVDISWVRTYGTIGPSHHCIVFLFVNQTLAVALLHLSRITPMLQLSTTLFCYWLPLLGAASSTACLAVGVHCSGTWKTSAFFLPTKQCTSNEASKSWAIVSSSSCINSSYNSVIPTVQALNRARRLARTVALIVLDYQFSKVSSPSWWNPLFGTDKKDQSNKDEHEY